MKMRNDSSIGAIPMGAKILVKRDAEKTKTDGGIILPEAAKEKPKSGTVVAVGKGRMLDNGQMHCVDAVVGDRILFSAYAGHDVEINGQEYLIMDEDNILAKVF